MKRSLLIIFAGLLSLASFAASIPEIIAGKHTAGETFTAKFTETKTMPKLKKETVKAGTLTFKAPENLRLDYSDPAGDYTLIEKGVFETKRGNSVQKLPIKNPEHKMSVLRATLLLAMQGKVEEVAKENDATVSYKESSTEYTCTLTPNKGSKAMAAEVVLVYEKKSGRLISLTFTESNGNYTTYKLAK